MVGLGQLQMAKCTVRCILQTQDVSFRSWKILGSQLTIESEAKANCLERLTASAAVAEASRSLHDDSPSIRIYIASNGLI